jgi:transposase-like protein
MLEAAISTGIPNPEVKEKATRRRFTAEYKRRILAEVERCRKPGELGALLRREGLYSSHLTQWRKAMAEEGRLGLEPKKRGRKPKPVNPLAKENERLQKELAKTKAKLEKANIVIEAQKKMAQLLGEPWIEETE